MRSFLFSDDPSSLQGDDTLVVTIPPDLADKTSLLACYSEGLRFPHYFGWNWDAFDECLRDQSWITENGVLIVHCDIPLKGSVADRKIYLDILLSTIEDWKVDHLRAFKVVFPKDVRDALQSICVHRGAEI